jgi:hypothetical protein
MFPRVVIPAARLIASSARLATATARQSIIKNLVAAPVPVRVMSATTYPIAHVQAKAGKDGRFTMTLEDASTALLAYR